MLRKDLITMPEFDLKGKKYKTDEDGFIDNPNEWDKDVAAYLATTENIANLTDEHWKVINYIRGYFLRFGIAPPIRMVVKNTGFQLNKIYELFPSGPAKGACKVAGLPKPTGCV